MSCIIYRTLKEIRHVTITMLCRRSAKQPPMNLNRTKMDPILFFLFCDVFTSFSEKISLVSCGRDLEFFFNYGVTNASKQCICVNQDNNYKLQSRKRKRRPTEQRKYYVKAYTRKHIDFLRTVFGYWFGLGARLSFPKPHPTIEEGKSITHDIYMNIIAQDHWEKLQRFDEHGVNGFALIYDPETWDLEVKVRYMSFTVDVAKSLNIVPPTIWHKSTENIRAMLPKAGTIFEYNDEPYQTLEEYKGQQVIIVVPCDDDADCNYAPPPLF
jgi:hypothetical protein